MYGRKIGAHWPSCWASLDEATAKLTEVLIRSGLKRSAAPHEEESAKGCARSSTRAALHRETRRAVHRHHVRRPAPRPILVAMESIHLITPWLDGSFQKLAEGIRGEGFVNDRNWRTRRVFVQCMRCNLPQGSMLATRTIREFLSPAWRLELRCSSSCSTSRKSSTVFSLVFREKPKRIGLDFSEDEGVILSGGGPLSRLPHCRVQWCFPPHSGRLPC